MYDKWPWHSHTQLISSSITTTQQHGDGKTQKRQGPNTTGQFHKPWKQCCLHIDTVGKNQLEKDKQIHATISTETGGMLSPWMSISWAYHSCQKFRPKHARIYSVPQNHHHGRERGGCGKILREHGYREVNSVESVKVHQQWEWEKAAQTVKLVFQSLTSTVQTLLVLHCVH